MNFYTFENTKLDSTGHYNLFEKTMVNNSKVGYEVFPVTDQFQGRLDLLCRYLHGNTNYLEELMTLNNIINPYSVKTNDKIKYYPNPTNYGLLYQSDVPQESKKDEILMMNRNKTTKKDKNRIGSPPTIKPDNLKQIDVNHSKKKIIIINKFR